MLNQILNLGETHFFEPDDILFVKGENTDKIFFIKKGFVQLLDEGAPFYSLVGKGAFLGIVEAFSNRLYKSTATVLGHGCIAVIDVKKFRDLCHSNAQVRSFIIRSLSLKMNDKERYFE